MITVGLLLTGLALAGEPGTRGARPGWHSPYTRDEAPESFVVPGSFDQPPVLQWVARLPGSRTSTAAHTERARPTVSGNVVYVGSAKGTALYALDRTRGFLLRRYPAGASVDAAPLAVGDYLFFADSGGTVWAYRAADGTLLWSYDAGAPVLTTPTLSNGVLYVATVDDLVIALDAANGAQSWRYKHRGELGRKVDLSLYAAPRPVLMGEQVLVGFSDGTLVALDAVAGDVAWQARVGEGRYPDLVGDPVAWAGIVLASGYDEPLVALDPATRQVVWTLPYGSAAAATVMGEGESAVLLHPGTDGKLRAVAPRTGTELWTWDSGDTGSITEAVVTEAGILVASSTGTLSLIDPQQGAVRWAFRPPFLLEGLSAPPTVEGRQLVFVTNAGRLYSLVVVQPDPPMAGPVETQARRKP